MTPTAQEAPRPLFRRKRVLIPAGLFSLVLVLGFLTSTGETRDTLETDRTRELTEAEAVAVTTVSTTTPTTTSTTTTTPIAAALVDSDFTSVDVAELTEAREQLAAAAIVAEFEGFSDYDRDAYDGGGWPDSDGDCQSDRHEILIKESIIETVLDAEGCRVETGLWIDPYDGTEYSDADQVSIDHVIPLAAAHRAGAWRWDEPSRRAFASDIAFPATHAVVGTDVNQSKADRGPEEWRPPSEEAWCRYAVDWTAVKTRWSLDFTDAEVSALEQMLDTCEPTTALTTNSVSLAPVSPTSTSTTTTSSSTTTTTTTPPSTVAPTTAPPPASDCHPNYSGCLPNLLGDALNCGDISAKNIRVSGADPYRLDGDGDGVGCES